MRQKMKVWKMIFVFISWWFSCSMKIFRGVYTYDYIHIHPEGQVPISMSHLVKESFKIGNLRSQKQKLQISSLWISGITVKTNHQFFVGGCKISGVLPPWVNFPTCIFSNNSWVFLQFCSCDVRMCIVSPFLYVEICVQIYMV